MQPNYENTHFKPHLAGFQATQTRLVRVAGFSRFIRRRAACAFVEQRQALVDTLSGRILFSAGKRIQRNRVRRRFRHACRLPRSADTRQHHVKRQLRRLSAQSLRCRYAQ